MKLVLKNVRISYPKLVEPVSFNGSEPKYEVNLLIPKTDTATVEAVNAAIVGAIEADLKRGAKSVLKTPVKPLPTLLKDGDDKPDPSQNGHWILTAKTKDAPKLVTTTHEIVTGDAIRETFYGGRYVSASLYIAPYNMGRKGVAARLQALLDSGEGEPFGGGARTIEDLFDLDTDDILNSFE